MILSQDDIEYRSGYEKYGEYNRRDEKSLLYAAARAVRAAIAAKSGGQPTAPALKQYCSDE